MKKGGNANSGDERNVQFTLLLSLRFKSELPLIGRHDVDKSLEVGGITFQSEDGTLYKVDMTKSVGSISKDDPCVMELELSAPDYDVYKSETPFVPKSALLKMEAVKNADIHLWSVRKASQGDVDFIDEKCESPIKLEDVLVFVDGKIRRLSPENCEAVTFDINDGDITPNPKYPGIRPDAVNCLYSNLQLIEALEANNIPVTEKNLKVLTDKAGWIKTQNDRQYFRKEINALRENKMFEESDKKADKASPAKGARI